MPDFTSLRPHVYTTGAVIYAFKHTLNETTIYGSHNAAMHASTGHTHSGSTGDGSPIKIKGAGVGLLTPSYDNTANNSTIVFPYTGASVRAAYENIPLRVGETKNLGLAISGTTLSVCSATGSALSATNMGYACIKDNTAGLIKTVPFSANTSITFGAASDTDGNLFGITDANWSVVMPIFIGIVTDGTDSYFTLSRKPFSVTGAAAGDLAQKGDTDADDTNNVMIWATGLTLANWVNKPITQVAWCLATYATVNSAWTFSLSSTSGTGFNDDYKKVWLAVPQAQNGAVANSYIVSNASTECTSGTDYTYRFGPDGKVDLYFSLSFAGGSGDDVARIILPIASNTTNMSGLGTISTVAFSTRASASSYTLQRMYDAYNYTNSGMSGGVFIMSGSYWSI